MHIKKTITVLALFTVLLCTAIAVAQIGSSRGQNKTAESLHAEEEQDPRQKTTDDPWVELGRVYEAFNTGGPVHFAGISSLTDEEGATMLEQAEFTCETDGKMFDYTLDSVAFVHQADISLNVYHREKLIVARDEKPLPGGMWAYANIDSLKSLAHRQETSAEVRTDGALKVIKIGNLGRSDVYGYEIHYNPSDYAVKKMILLLATLEDVDGSEGEGKVDEAATAAGESETETRAEQDTTDTTAAIEFNMYRLEMQYNSFEKIEENRFNPLDKYGRINRRTFRLREAYSAYRFVWAGAPDKEIKIQ